MLRSPIYRDPRRQRPENVPKTRPTPTGGRCGKSPMILSMTGFAAVAAELPGVSLSVELRSVNHRYLDLTAQAPGRAAHARAGAAGDACRRAAARQGRVPHCAQPLAAGRATAWPSTPARDRPAGRSGGGSDARRPGRRAAVRQRDPALAGRPGRADRAAGRARRDARTTWSTRRCASLPRRARAKAPRPRRVLEACCAGIEAQVARVAPRIPAIHAAYNEKLGDALARSGARSRTRTG